MTSIPPLPLSTEWAIRLRCSFQISSGLVLNLSLERVNSTWRNNSFIDNFSKQRKRQEPRLKIFITWSRKCVALHVWRILSTCEIMLVLHHSVDSVSNTIASSIVPANKHWRAHPIWATWPQIPFPVFGCNRGAWARHGLQGGVG